MSDTSSTCSNFAGAGAAGGAATSLEMSAWVSVATAVALGARFLAALGAGMLGPGSAAVSMLMVCSFESAELSPAEPDDLHLAAAPGTHPLDSKWVNPIRLSDVTQGTAMQLPSE